MPKNKDAYTRYRIIDRVLRSRKHLLRRRYVKTKELAKICAEEMGKDSISTRTIQIDIENMRYDTGLRMNAPIQKSTKERAYFYPENVDEIFPAIELTDEEISALLFYGQVQNQYQQFKIFDEIISAIDKVLDRANVKKEYREVLSGQPIIQTEKTPNIKGSELLLKIIQALINKKKIKFDYNKGFSEKNERVFSPYILKEDKHFWYVVGLLDVENEVRTFAVDRMSNVRIVNEEIQKVHFNPKNYFKYSYGIIVEQTEPIEVVLSFDPYQGNYLKTLPLHETQRVLIDSKEELRVSVLIKPAYEFYAKILEYGDRVEVISPESVREVIEQKLSRALSKYQKKN